MRGTDGVYREPPQSISGERSWWCKADKDSSYQPIERGKMTLYRGIWIYYSSHGRSHSIDVMPSETRRRGFGIDGKTREQVFERLDDWIDGRGLHRDPKRSKTKTKSPRQAMPLQERLAYFPLPTTAIDVTDRWAHWNEARKCIHVSIYIGVPGCVSKTIYVGYYHDWDAARAASVEACTIINAEIARRRSL